MPPANDVGSAAIFLASAVIAGPAMPNALTTLAANASPPENDGGGSLSRAAEVLVSTVPMEVNSATSFFTAAAGLDCALDPSEVSDWETCTTGARPVQKAV